MKQEKKQSDIDWYNYQNRNNWKIEQYNKTTIYNTVQN
jgi:hypothetical protein